MYCVMKIEVYGYQLATEVGLLILESNFLEVNEFWSIASSRQTRSWGNHYLSIAL